MALLWLVANVQDAMIPFYITELRPSTEHLSKHVGYDSAAYH